MSYKFQIRIEEARKRLKDNLRRMAQHDAYDIFNQEIEDAHHMLNNQKLTSGE